MLNNLHAILDWETLSTEHYAYPVSYGLVVFSMEDGIISTVGANINAYDMQHLLKIDPKTVTWWINQPKGVYQNAERTLPLFKALAEINGILHDQGVDHLWGHGKEFDVSLFHDYLSLYPDFVWEPMDGAEFWATRDTRTLFDMFPEIPRHKATISHDPIADAEAEALTIIDCFKRMKELRDAE